MRQIGVELLRVLKALYKPSKWLWGQLTPLGFGVKLKKNARIFYQIFL